MKGILLVNMGGPFTPKELKKFLRLMFKDPYILPFGKLGRNLLSFIISNTRYKKSWEKYELIGGSPIIEATSDTLFALQDMMGRKDYDVRMGFSYSFPYIDHSIDTYLRDNVNDVLIIPLYPQASYSTTSSVMKVADDYVLRKKDVKVSFVKEFHNHPGFVSFWANLIDSHIKEHKYTNPYLVFSAHSIPQSLVDKGDTYANSIETCSKAIAEKAGLSNKYEVAYQSRMNKKGWLGPDTKSSLMKLAEKESQDIILIPISFVSENLETLYDLDHDIIPFAKSIPGIKNISRVKIPIANDDFLNLLRDLVETNTRK